MDPLAAVTLLDRPLIQSVAAAARKSSRARMNYNFHTGPEDNPHRFLNVLLEGTYVTPHRHLNPPKSEAFLVIEGAAAVFVFDDAGAVAGSYVLGETDPLPERLRESPRGIAVDLPPGVWHTVVALTPEVVCYEVKPGPWIASNDKEFAPWAPKEGEPGAAGYLASLLGAPLRIQS
ncbi:MAG: WbuC family cupin fold metalloprotein [Bryobacteraceae bacterium]|nr:WbuC family cupin fold metalloprotein [Bryobacteraceae bacterium]